MLKINNTFWNMKSFVDSFFKLLETNWSIVWIVEEFEKTGDVIVVGVCVDYMHHRFELVLSEWLSVVLVKVPEHFSDVNFVGKNNPLKFTEHLFGSLSDCAEFVVTCLVGEGVTEQELKFVKIDWAVPIGVEFLEHSLDFIVV